MEGTSHWPLRRVLTLGGCQVLWLRHSVHMEDCGGWWLSSGSIPCIYIQWGKNHGLIVFNDTNGNFSSRSRMNSSADLVCTVNSLCNSLGKDSQRAAVLHMACVLRSNVPQSVHLFWEAHWSLYYHLFWEAYQCTTINPLTNGGRPGTDASSIAHCTCMCLYDHTTIA